VHTGKVKSGPTTKKIGAYKVKEDGNTLRIDL